MPYIDIDTENLNGYYLVIIVLLDNTHQSWEGDFYRLGLENMYCKQ